jgi:hypothetical protein
MSLQGRLGSLFNNSPRSSPDRSRPVSPPPSGTRAIDVVDPSGAPVGNTHQQDTRDMVSRAASIASTSQSWTSPITRWFTGSGSPAVAQPPLAAVSESPGRSLHRRYPSDSLLRSESSISSARPERKSEDLPAFTRRTEEDPSIALHQAISDEVFRLRKPPEALMPPHHHHHKESPLHHSASVGSRSARHPVLLDNLARASMPTSSLSRPLAYSSSLRVQPNLVTSPVSMSRLPFTSITGVPRDNERSATLETLRSLSARDRGIQTSSTSMLPAVGSGVTRWWFQDDNKGAVDDLLKEEDQASTAQEEAEAIRKKCECVIISITHAHVL